MSEKLDRSPGRAYHASTLFILVGFLLVCAALVSYFGGNTLQSTATEALIRLVAVVGIYAFIGNSGLLSFGHVGFMCIGAYAAAWATCDPMWKKLMLRDLPFFLQEYAYGYVFSLTFAAVLCAAVALVLGLAILRLSGIASTIATFGFLIVLNSIYSNWSGLTAGTSSVIGIPVFVNLWWALLLAAVAIIVAWLYQNSRFGLMLRATRESIPAAQASGISVVKTRLVGFVVSAAMCGVAGALYAHFIGILSPDSLYLDMTFILLAMLVIGGMSSLSGAVVGTVFVSVLNELLRSAERGVEVFNTAVSLPSGAQQLGLALMLALVLLFKPDGLVGASELVLKPRLNRN